MTTLAPVARAAAAPSRLPARLTALLAALEVPDCDCPLVLRPLCVLHGTCEYREEGRACQCPRWAGPPCQHLRRWAAGFRVERDPHDLEQRALQWAHLLWTHRRRLYADRPTPGAGAVLLDRDLRVRVMALRRRLKLSLWHPRDVRTPTEDGGETRRTAARVAAFQAVLGKAVRNVAA